MPCRGGLFRDRHVTLLTKDVAICKDNVKKHWNDYVTLSTDVLNFYKAQDGDDYLELDAFDTFKGQIMKKATKFELNATLRKSEQTDFDFMVDLIARTVFYARGGCPGNIRETLSEYQGNVK